MKRAIFWLFAILFFFVPLILWPYTSEVFEFNKMVFVYLITTLIACVWAIRMIRERKFIFRRTILDIPLLIFIGSQLISTFFSIDPLTSWLGYYSRFNGGFVSTLCYSLLYWAFVSNLDAKSALNTIRYTLVSAALVSIYAVLEHFGIDKNIWVQDVASRVFSTLGQPNWLAAWVVALMPITWAFTITNFQFSIFKKFSISQFLKLLLPFSLSILFFWTLIFTKSRSGLLGFAVAFAVFWALHFWQNSRLTDPGSDRQKNNVTPFVIICFSLLVIGLISGTEFTPNFYSLINHSSNQQIIKPSGGTALETGGTESGTIRKIVWKGAIQVWLHNPIIGTGVETFAYSYYKYRPAEHNLTSEWDFIYNKAHNEFLNFAANTGTVGIIAYLGLIFFSVIQITNFRSPIFNKFKNLNIKNSIKIALLAGYASLLVTNFFGFSVVPTQLQFFLFPAIAVGLAISNKREEIGKVSLSTVQKTSIVILSLIASYLLLIIARYWFADTLYAKGKAYNSASRPDTASGFLTQAIVLEPNQPLYHSELAGSYTNMALAFYQQKDAENTKKLTDAAISESDTAISLSPANVNLKRARFGIFIMLSTINSNYLTEAGNTLLDAIKSAPTDAKLYYNLGLTYARTGQTGQAIEILKKTIELKANYKEARLAYAILLINKNQIPEAKAQLQYILTNIDPNDSLTKQTLEGIR